jgi:hypothetical protein
MISKWLFLAFVGMSLVPACPLPGQRSQLSGLITDPVGLPDPGATIKVHGHEIGATRRSVTNHQTCRSPWVP